MTVQWENIDLPLFTGIDTRTDETVLPPVKLSDLQNAVFDNTGALTKRNGSVKLTNRVDTVVDGDEVVTTFITRAQFLARRDKELLLSDGTNLYAYSPTIDRWVDKGFYRGMHVTKKVVADAASVQTTADMASNEGVEVFAWEDSRGGIWYAAYDAVSGVELLTSKQLHATGIRPRVVAIDKTIHIIYAQGGDLFTKRLVPNDLHQSDSVGPIAFGFADVPAEAGFGLDAISVPSRKAALWVYVTNTTVVKMGFLTQTGAIGSPSTGHASPVTFGTLANGLLALAVYERDTTHYACAYANTAGTVFAEIRTKELVASASASVTLESPVRLTATWNAAKQLSVFWERTAADSWNHFVRRIIWTETGAVASPAADYARHSGVGTHAYESRNLAVVGLVHASPLQNTYFLMNEQQRPSARVLAGTGNGLPAKTHLPRVSSPEPNVFEFAAIYRVRLDSGLDAASNPPSQTGVYADPGVKHVKISLDDPRAKSWVYRDGVTYLSGGFLWAYDGVSAVESGFLLFPENITLTDGIGTGNTYGYRVYAGWINALGQRELSTTAKVVVAQQNNAVDGVSTITLTIPTIAHTWKQGARKNLAFYVYRSQANSNTYNLVSSLDPAVTTGNNRYVDNDPAIDSVTFVDGMTDAIAATKELDYLNTGEFDNVAPPPLSQLALVQNRIWGVSGEDHHRIVFSKLLEPGVPAAFNEALEKALPEEVTGVGELNAQVVLFSENEQFLLPGDGPNNLGFGDYGEVVQYNNGSGVTNHRTLLETPLGLMFLTSKGFRVLQRDGSVVNVGSDVHLYRSQDFTHADLLAEVKQVRFLTSSGRTLMFDYERGLWSTFTNYEGVSAVLVDNVYYYAKATGEVFKESPGLYRDGVIPVALALTLGWWVKPQGNLGFALCRRVGFLGKYFSGHKLRFETGYDYEDNYRDSVLVDPSTFIESSTWGSGATWGSDAVWGGSGRSRVYNFRRRLSRLKFTALRCRLTELPGEAESEGLRLLSLTAEIGRLPGMQRHSSARSV